MLVLVGFGHTPLEAPQHVSNGTHPKTASPPLLGWALITRGSRAVIVNGPVTRGKRDGAPHRPTPHPVVVDLRIKDS